jgi:hypothetical protein
MMPLSLVACLPQAGERAGVRVDIVTSPFPSSLPAAGRPFHQGREDIMKIKIGGDSCRLFF